MAHELTTNCHRGTDHTDCGQQLGRGMKIQIDALFATLKDLL